MKLARAWKALARLERELLIVESILGHARIGLGIALGAGLAGFAGRGWWIAAIVGGVMAAWYGTKAWLVTNLLEDRRCRICGECSEEDLD